MTKASFIQSVSRLLLFGTGLILLLRCTAVDGFHGLDGTASGLLGDEVIVGEAETLAGRATVEWSALPHESSPLRAGVNNGPSPSTADSFQAMSSDGVYPPDPSGAVGPNHIVVVTNGTVKITNRAGTQVGTPVSLSNFWDASFGLNGGAIHPRAVYDPYGQRFIIASRGDSYIMVDDGDGGQKKKYTYFMMLAVSQSSDPTGGWYQYKTQVDDGTYDPTFTAIGFNKNWIAVGMAITSSVNGGFIYLNLRKETPVWVFGKTAVYANGSPTIKKLSRNDGFHTQLIPAITLDPSLEDLYVMQDSSDSNGQLRVLRISGALGSESIAIVGTSSSGISWAGSYSTNDNGAPYGIDSLPQNGTSIKFAAGDARLSNVVYRNGGLWTTHTVFLPAATPTHAAVQWWQVNPSTAAMVQRGLIEDSTGTVSYALPSIAVSGTGDVLLSYSAFSASTYVTPSYAFRQASDATNTLRDGVTLKTSSDRYDRSQGFIFETVNNNWGAYSTTLVDPVDDSGLWTLQSFVPSRNEWGLWWGRIHPVIPTLTSPGDQSVAEGATLTFPLAATDSNGATMTYSGSNLPTGATVSPAGVFSWTPTYLQAGNYSVTLTARNPGGFTDSKTITITVTNVFDPPVLTHIGPKSGTENALLQFTVFATDPQSHPLTYSVSGLPSGAAFDAATHVFSWTPGFAQSGSYDVLFTVQDDIPLSASETVTITIGNTNRAPTLAAVGDRSTPEASTISLTLSGSDPDGDALTFGGTGLPPGAVLDPATGFFSWTPTYDQAGVYQTVFSVSDSGGLTAIQNVTFTVTNVNRAPTLAAIGPRTGAEGQTLAFGVAGSDPDGDSIAFTATGLPSGATFTGAAGFSWTPDYTQAGTYSVTFTVTDGAGLNVSETVQITITNVNRAPVLAAIPELHGAEGTPLTIDLAGSDPDLEPVAYSANGLPTGSTFSALTGRFSWTPGYTDAGTYTVAFRATDPGGLYAEQTATIIIANTNRAPVFDQLDAQTVLEHQALTFAVTAVDPDGQAVTLAVVALPTGATFDPPTGAFAWTPGTAQSGIYNVTFKATDEEGLSSTARITITVVGTNKPPAMHPIDPIVASAGRFLTFVAIADDPNSDPLLYSVQRLPAGANFDGLTGSFTWQTERTQVGSYSMTIVATDPQGLSDSTSVSITLVPNQPPVITEVPPLFGAEGSMLSYTVLASDPNGDPLTFSASDLPTGATFDAATHALRWTPSYDQAGTYTVTFTVSDTLDPVSTSTTISVANTNRPPTLTAIGPRTVSEGTPVLFGVSGADPDGDPITFSTSSLPPGAVFDAANHVFRWTPGYRDEGSYTVTFSVTDAPGLSSSETVTITVLGANGPPSFDSLGTQYGAEGLPLSFVVSATDPDDDPLTITASTVPSGASFDSGAQTFSWTPGYTQAGTYSVTFRVTDPGGQFSTQTISVVVVNTDRAPQLDPIGPHSGAEASLLLFTVHGTDPDGDSVVLSAGNLPDGATFNPADGKFSWTPSFGQEGTYTTSFTVSDGTLSSSEDVTLTIVHTNRGPTLSPVGTLNGAENVNLTYQLVATDPDSDVLTYSASDLPAGASLDPGTGLFTWTPGYSDARSYTVTWRVTDSSGLSSSVTSTIQISNTNRPPILEPIESQTISETQSVSFAVTASDPDGDTVTLTAVAIPTGAQFSPTTGIFSWTPAYLQAGIYTLTFKATDQNNASATARTTLTVLGTAGAPVLSQMEPLTIAAGRTIAFTLLAYDPNADPLTFSTLRALPEGATLDPETGAFLWPTTTTQVGTYSITFIATDPGQLKASSPLSITLTPNHAPVFDPIAPQTGAERVPLSFQVSATDEESDALTFSATNLPVGASFDRGTRMFTWTPSYVQSGDYQVTFTVTDGLDSATTDVTILIANTDRAPGITPIGTKSGAEGSELSFTVEGFDPDSDRLTYSAVGLPPGALFPASEHTFRWTPNYDQAGSYDVTFTVLDPDGQTASEVVTVSIANTNRAPVITAIPRQSGIEASPLSFRVAASDPDGDAVTYSANALPRGASFDGQSQVFEWTPDFTQAGTYAIDFIATDSGGLSSTQTASIVITNVNRPPTIDPIPAQSGPEGMPITFTVHAADLDSDTLTYGLEMGPEGATIDPASGAFAWTPGFTDSGSHTAVVTVSDNAGGSDTKLVTINVTNVRRPPVLMTIGARTVAEGSPLTFGVMAADPDGGTLGYQAQGLPSGATLDAATGAFRWTPDFTQAAVYTVVFSVTNDVALSATESVTITVTNTNRAPVIDPIADKSVLMRTALTFTATGTDPDGDSLTWSATNLPIGATFDPQTRSFAWTPDRTQGGPTSFTITASDGSLSTSTDVHVTVTSGMNPPSFVMVPAEVSGASGKRLSFVVTATDPDGDTVTITTADLPAHAAFEPLTGSVSWTPGASDVGEHVVHFTATDSTGLTATAQTTIKVTRGVGVGCHCGPGGDVSGLLLLGLLTLVRRRRSLAA